MIIWSRCISKRETYQKKNSRPNAVHFLRRNLLNVLDRFQDTQNTIVDDFRTHLQRWENNTNRWESGYYKNDNVTLFAQEVAALTINELSDDIKLTGKSHYAHDYGHRSYWLSYLPSIEINLYYEIGINPSKDNQSCTDAFVAIWYNIHDAALINTLEKLDIQEKQMA